MTDLSGTIQTIKKKGEGGGGELPVDVQFFNFYPNLQIDFEYKTNIAFPTQTKFLGNI